MELVDWGSWKKRKGGGRGDGQVKAQTEGKGTYGHGKGFKERGGNLGKDRTFLRKAT